MPKKNPIYFDEAVRMVEGKSFECAMVERRPYESAWYLDYFVDWISEIGYHIEISGDEFEGVEE